MSRLKKAAIIFVILTILFLVTQLRWPFAESLHNWLVNNQSVPADQVPLTPGGYVDFLTLSNNQRGENVTVDNNVLVDLYQILPEENDGLVQVSDKYLELLGNPEYNNDRPYVQSSEIGKRPNTGDEESIDVYELCLSKPWLSGEFPECKEWLDQNQSSLNKMVAASTKPYYFHPLVNTNDEEFSPMIGALLEHAQMMRDVARGLSIRSLNHLAEDRIDECLADMAAIRRLGAKMRQGPTLVEQLVSIAIVGIVFEHESTVLSSGKLTLEQCRDYQKVIVETTRAGTLSDCLQSGERLMMMDAIQWMAAGNASMGGMMGVRDSSIDFATYFSSFVDWRATAMRCDEYYDQLIDVASIEDDRDRRAALQEFEDQLESLEAGEKSAVATVMQMLAGARSRGKVMGDYLVAMLMPAMMQVDAAHVRGKMHGISAIGFELEHYRLNEGKFPESLDDLPGELVSSLRTDRFTGKSIKYVKADNGYRLYSDGANGVDEQMDADGNLIDHSEEGAIRDDVVVEVKLDSK